MIEACHPLFANKKIDIELVSKNAFSFRNYLVYFPDITSALPK